MHLNQAGSASSGELTKAVPHMVVEIIEYVNNAVVSKTILKKSTGNVTAMSFDTGEELSDKISPYDNFVQIIDGVAELTINKEVHHLKLGNGIIIPAHAQHAFAAKEKFKIISTIIKSGYED